MMKTTNGSSIDSSLLESMHTSLGSASSDVDSSVIADFYRGRSIFITGATGFMGKVSSLQFSRKVVQIMWN